MTHFAVAVFTEDNSNDAIEAAMAPFYTFEMDGEETVYVEDIDITEEVIESWNQYAVMVIRLKDGTTHSKNKDLFWRDATEDEIVQLQNKSYNGTYRITEKNGVTSYTIRYIPDGAEEVRLSGPEYYPQLRDFVEYYYGYMPKGDDDNKYGYTILNELGECTKVIRRTNPNSKYDYYSIGGRWSGLLMEKGNPNVVNTCRLSELDWHGMTDHAKTIAANIWDINYPKLVELMKEIPSTKNEILSDEEVLSRLENTMKYANIVWDFRPNDTRETYISRTTANITPESIVYDGEWIEPDNMPIVEWNMLFNDIWEKEKQNPNMHITIVDCHN